MLISQNNSIYTTAVQKFCFNFKRSSTLVKKLTPGNSFPSNNSNEAPPPVLTCDKDLFYNNKGLISFKYNK
jgi:hypothetical protein